MWGNNFMIEVSLSSVLLVVLSVDLLCICSGRLDLTEVGAVGHRLFV